MFDVFYIGAKPDLFAFEKSATCLENAAEQSRTEFFWFIHGTNDYTNFDFNWAPPPWEHQYTHVFPSQWHANGGVYFASKTHADKTKLKFQHCQSVNRQINMNNWIVPPDLDVDNFDFSWHPNPLESDYEYHFATQWQKAGGPVYRGTAGVKCVDVQRATRIINMNNWTVPPDLDVDNFDFSWHPNPLESDYEYHFATQWQKAGGPVYRGTAGVKCVDVQRATRIINMNNWTVPPDLDVDNFDFSWHPNPLDSDYEYHFPTQWQKAGGPVYRGTAGVKYVATQKAYTNATQIFYMDFMNPGSADQLADLCERYPDIKSTRYVSDHLNVLKRIMNLAESKFVWVISSICNYADFDFTWHPEHWQEDMIHCFPSGKQKRGDTFYINVDSFKTQMYNLEMLDWFNVINYCKDQSADRILDPTVYYETDDLVSTIKNYDFKFPYATFSNQAARPLLWQHPCLWTEKDRSVESFTRSNSVCVVPRDVKAYLRTQLYDYPYINAQDKTFFAEKSLDIVYISNGEPDEQRWYDELLQVTKKDPDQITWIRGVNGRANAYKAAAHASKTPWFFTVFAKLQVSSEFDWTWKPDYFQEPKHYIFNSRNPVNGLEYGHQGMIAYNKRLVLETVNSGLDFTLSKAHEVVPILSGTAHFNQNPWMTWRTAFREVIKLKHFQSLTSTVETAHRLKVWLNKAEGLHSEWCLRGAADAVEYYESVAGDFSKLMLSYEWNWLQSYYDSKYRN